MPRLIDADALFKRITSTYDCVPIDVLEMIEGMPTIEAEPVRRGKWIDENCSICGQYVYHGDARNFCPSCGARMEVSE